MDSGNSGSISSSGDEEYDSRAEMFPAFLNPHTQFGSLVSHHPSFLDLSPSYLQPNSNPNSLLNLETGNSQGLRSESNCTVPGVSSSAAATKQCLLAAPPDDNARVSAATSAVRNSKKRTRASRRAPTTVLTTDTSNFRAMVQEFTGIPAPPFSPSSYSRRLSASSSSFYPLRPSPQKLLPSSSSSSPSPSTIFCMADALASTSATPSASINYQLPPDLGLPYNHPQNMLSMHILPFQTPTTLHPLTNPLPKSQPSLSLPSLEDLGMSHAHLISPTHAHLTSEGMPLMRSQDIGYRDGGPTGEGTRDELRSFDASYGKVAASCKLNFSASSSSTTFNHDKNLENNSARGDGTIDSWICSSD